MLKITRKVEYALIALRHLQQKERGQLSSAKSMALEYGIPQELLAKILQKLSKEEILSMCLDMKEVLVFLLEKL